VRETGVRDEFSAKFWSETDAHKATGTF